MKSLRSRIMHFVRHWHARIGVLAAIFFLFLSVSGIALNHTDALRLDRIQIQTDWLMRWYGIGAAVPVRGYLLKDGYFAASDERWVMDGHELHARELSAMNQTPVGAVAWGGMRAIAIKDHLFLYMPDGQLVDSISAAALPDVPIKQLGVTHVDAVPALVLQTAKGDFISKDGLEWQILSGKDVNAYSMLAWANEQALPKSLSGSLVKSFSPSLPLERIVLDMHSGRIFGRYGPILMDVAAVLLMVLSLSGVWIYLRTVRRRPQR